MFNFAICARNSRQGWTSVHVAGEHHDRGTHFPPTPLLLYHVDKIGEPERDFHLSIEEEKDRVDMGDEVAKAEGEGERIGLGVKFGIDRIT